MESTAVEVPLPNYWEPWDYTRQSLHTVELKESDNEFKEVFSHFRASIHYLDSRRSCPQYNDASPIRVTRVQNHYLWAAFHNTKERLKLLSEHYPNLVQGTSQPGNADYVPPVLKGFQWSVTHPSTEAQVNEVRLWHGTSHEVSQLIAKDGFDPRRAALEGRLGAACYFADCVPKSFAYTKCTAKNCRANHGLLKSHCKDPQHLRNSPRVIILARVLLGTPKIVYDSLKKIRLAPDGKDSIIAPSKHCLENVPGRLNSTFWFSEYTVYEKSFAYPEYIIEWLPQDPKIHERSLPIPRGLHLDRPVHNPEWYRLSRRPGQQFQISQQSLLQVPVQANNSAPHPQQTNPQHRSQQPQQQPSVSQGDQTAQQSAWDEPPVSLDNSDYVEKDESEERVLDYNPDLLTLSVLCNELLQLPAFQQASFIRTLGEEGKDSSFLPQLVALRTQPDLLPLVKARYELKSIPLLLPEAVLPRSLRSQSQMAPVEDVFRDIRDELPAPLLAACVAYLDTGRDSFVDLREFELFHAVFGPSYGASLRTFGDRVWLRYFDTNDDWLAQKPRGCFLVRLNSLTRTALTLGLVKSPVCQDLRTDVQKVKVLTDMRSEGVRIEKLMEGPTLPVLLGRIEGLDFPTWNNQALPPHTFVPNLLQNFRSRVDILCSLESKLESTALRPETLTFFSSLSELSQHLDALTRRPFDGSWDSLFDAIKTPFLLQMELKQIFIRSKQCETFALSLFGQGVPIYHRFRSHPIFRYLRANEQTRANYEALVAMENLLSRASSMVAGSPSREVQATMGAVEEAVLNLANSEEGGWNRVKTNPFLRGKLGDLNLAVTYLVQDIQNPGVRRDVDALCYDLNEGFTLIEAVNSGEVQLPKVWRDAFGDNAYEQSAENVKTLFRNYFGPNAFNEEHWKAINQILQRRPSVTVPSGVVGSFTASVAEKDKAIPLSVFCALLSWIGDLPAGLPPPLKQQKLRNLLELATAPWFLGFVSRSYSSLNLIDWRANVPASYFYARVSNQNPNLVTIDFLEHGPVDAYGNAPEVARVRLQPPLSQLSESGPNAGRLDPNWTMPLELVNGQPRAYYVDGAPTVVELIRKFMAKTGWRAPLKPHPVRFEDEWKRDAGRGSEYINNRVAPDGQGGLVAPAVKKPEQVPGSPTLDVLLEICELNKPAIATKLRSLGIRDIADLCRAVAGETLDAFGLKLLGSAWPGANPPGANRDRLLLLVDVARAQTMLETCYDHPTPLTFPDREAYDTHMASQHNDLDRTNSPNSPFRVGSPGPNPAARVAASNNLSRSNSPSFPS